MNTLSLTKSLILQISSNLYYLNNKYNCKEKNILIDYILENYTSKVSRKNFLINKSTWQNEESWFKSIIWSNRFSYIYLDFIHSDSFFQPVYFIHKYDYFINNLIFSLQWFNLKYYPLHFYGSPWRCFVENQYFVYYV